MNTHTDAPIKRPTGIQFAVLAVGGTLLGLVLGVIAGTLGGRLFEGAEGFGNVVAAILGAIIGYTIGVSLGVYGLGTWLNRRASISTWRWSYWLALLGSVLGAVLVLLAAEPLHLNQNTALLQACLIILPPIGATLGFSLRRKKVT